MKYDNKSFIRLALGSYNVEDIANDFDFQFDKKLISIIQKELMKLYW